MSDIVRDPYGNPLNGFATITALTAEVKRLRADIAYADKHAEKVESLLWGTARENERLRAAPPPWRPIETAPTDGTVVLVFAEERQGLPAFQCTAAYHEDAGWCVDELREVTHWMPLPPPPQKRGGSDD